MALFRALESRAPAGERLVFDPEAERFLSPRLRAVVVAARVPALRRATVRIIDERWPGPRLSGVVRTKVIDDFVLATMSGGAVQLVLLGAGYDTRASRLALPPGTSVFEIDHPLTQARKRDRRRRCSREISYLPVDFEREGLAEALRRSSFVPGIPSCVIWEGVFSYLTAEAIDATLAALRELCAPESRLLLTYIAESALERPSAWVRAVVDAGEPFRTTLTPASSLSFFAERSMSLLNDESTREAALRLGVADAETIPDFYRLATLAF